MPDILGQLFGQPQQAQDPQGLVQNILSQRFQPMPEDAAGAMGQTLLSGQVVNPSQVAQQRIALPMGIAGQLSNMNLQGQQAQGENLKNQMTAFQMPYMQEMYRQMYGGGQENGQPQQGNMPPVGFQQEQIDPRLKEARLAAMMGNKGLSESDMAIYNADPNVIAKKSESEKSGATAAESGKTLNVMSANLPVVMQRLKEMEDAVPEASYGLGVNNEGTGFKQQVASQFGYDKANAILQQRAAQGVLPELGPQLAQAGIRGNKFLEMLASSASGLNMAGSPEAKTAAIQGLREQYISNLKSTARQVRAQGGQAPSDAEIDAQVSQYLKGVGNTTGAAQATGNTQKQQTSGSQQIHWNDLQ